MKKIDPEFDTYDYVLFLALFWSGGGPHDIPGIIHAYDWVNREIISREEFISAINKLIAWKLVTHDENNFSIPEHIKQEFDAFRKKKRKDRFEVAKLYIKKQPQLNEVPIEISPTEKEFNEYINENHKAMQEIMKDL